MVDISFRRLRRELNHYGLFYHAFEQTSATRKCQPAKQPLHRSKGNKQCRRSRDPETEAIKAIHQYACQAVAEQGAKAKNDVGRAVLARQQVSHPPGGENGKYESQHEWLHIAKVSES